MDAGAPYLRIVAEIRRRITSGELKPGDRTPSTRAITEDWSVAMATATKVIAALKQQGLVESRPGSGTFVRTDLGQRNPPQLSSAELGQAQLGQPQAALSRTAVIRVACEIADVEGLAMLSMRRVAGRLGVSTMALYRHVPGKEALTLLMADTVLGEEPIPAPGLRGWRQRLELVARLMWTIFRRHPWAAEVISLTRPQALPNLLAFGEYTLAALRKAGFGTDDMMYIQLTLIGHVRAVAQNLQSEIRARQDTGLGADDWLDSQAMTWGRLLASGRYPALGSVAEKEFDFNLDAVFEYGLQRLLDGVEVRRRAVLRPEP